MNTKEKKEKFDVPEFQVIEFISTAALEDAITNSKKESEEACFRCMATIHGPKNGEHCISNCNAAEMLRIRETKYSAMMK